MQKQSQITSRACIASEIADMCSRQELILAIEQQLIQSSISPEEKKNFQTFVVDDQKSISLLETIKMEHGMPGIEKPLAAQLGLFARSVFRKSDVSLLEKVTLLSLLKAAQLNCGHLVFKAAFALPPDAQPALALMSAVNAGNAAHVRKLNVFSEKMFFSRHFGELPPDTFLSRAKELWATVSGRIALPLARGAEDMPISAVLRQEHSKVQMLFAEIDASNNPQLSFELFTQLSLDLSAHSAAEEQAFYLPISAFIEMEPLAETSFDEHDQIRTLVATARDLPPATPQFKQAVKLLQSVVTKHVTQEENIVIPAAEKKLSRSSLKTMSAQFKVAKLQYLEDYGPQFLQEVG